MKKGLFVSAVIAVFVGLCSFLSQEEREILVKKDDYTIVCENDTVLNLSPFRLEVLVHPQEVSIENCKVLSSIINPPIKDGVAKIAFKAAGVNVHEKTGLCKHRILIDIHIGDEVHKEVIEYWVKK